MSVAGRCDQCGLDLQVTFFGPNKYCHGCLFNFVDAGDYASDNEIVTTCDRCEDVIPNGYSTYCGSCMECSNCSAQAEYCDSCSESYSECDQAHGCHYCGDDDEVYCEEHATNEWGAPKRCGECGDEVDILYTYCDPCYRDVISKPPADEPVTTIEDGVVTVDGISVSWN